MRRICIFLWIALSVSAAAQSSSAEPSLAPAKQPQTARQALIEMFLGKNPDDFAKHLPKAAAQALVSKGETPEDSVMLRISMVGRQLGASEHVETFDEGPMLLVAENNVGKEKTRFEAMVEHDSFSGDSDEIELSVNFYRDGKEEFLYVVPRLTFSFLQENEVWKLSDLTITAQVPLTDAEYLKGVRKKVNENNEIQASARITMLAAFETKYAASHPGRGYTCNLSDLYPNAPAEEFTGYAYAANIGASESAGYHYELSGCDGNPATRFQIIATPIDAEEGMKAFCADESGSVRSQANGNGSECLSHGEVVNKAEGVNPTVE